MECAEGRGRYQHLRFSGIYGHKLQLYEVRYLFLRRSGPEVVRFAGFSREAGRRRERLDRPDVFRLYIGAQAVTAGFHRKEKVGLVAIRAYPCAIDTESGRWRPNVDRVVIPGIANYVYQCLASVGLRRWMLLLVRFHIEVNFIRPTAGRYQSVCR